MDDDQIMRNRRQIWPIKMQTQKDIGRILLIFFTLFISAAWIQVLQINIDINTGDPIFLEAFYKDIFINHNPLHGWLVPKSPYYFPDVLLYCIFRFLAGDYALATYLYSLFTYLIIILSLYFILMKSIKKDPIKILSNVCIWGLVLLLATSISTWSGPQNLFGVINYGSSGPLLQPLFHSGAILNGILVAYLWMKIIYAEEHQVFNSFLLTSFVAISVASDLWIIPWTFSGLVVGTFYHLRLEKSRKRTHNFVYGVISIFLGSIIGITLNSLMGTFKLVYFSNVQTGIPNQSINTSIEATFNLIKNAVIISPAAWIMLFLLCLSGGYALKNSHSNSRKSSLGRAIAVEEKQIQLITKILLLVLVVAFFSTLIITIYENLISDVGQIRYFTGVFFVLWIYSGYFLITQMKTNKFFRLILPAILVICSSFSLIQINNFASLSIFGPRTNYPANIYCLDQLAVKHNLKHGVGEYYFAKPTTVLTKANLVITQTTYNFDIYHWVSTYFYNFASDSRRSLPKLDFVLSDPYRPRYSEIQDIFGKAESIESCGAWRVFLYTGDSGKKLNEVMKVKINDYFKVLDDPRIETPLR